MANIQIGWVDYSKEERNKVVSILKLLGNQGALDELGIGQVRDAFSDKLFPGISVLQTRAKYFVLIPYLFHLAEEEAEKEGKFKNSREVLKFINENEKKLMGTLIKNSGEDANGIIGSRNFKQGRTVRMKPSSIYWNGMRTNEILLHPDFSLDMACSTVLYRGKNKTTIKLKNEEKEACGDDADVNCDGHLLFEPIVPAYDFMKEASIDLTVEEAEYIYERFTTSDTTKDSLLAYMLKHPELCESYENFDEIEPDIFKAVDRNLYEKVRLAREFTEFIYGAHLLYNIIYAESCNVEDETVKTIKEEFEKYCLEYKSPDLEGIFDMTKCAAGTRAFIQNFDVRMKENDVESLKKIIIEREKRVKPHRNKLNRPADFYFEKPIHYFKLTYRYGTARTIMLDIINGLGGEFRCQDSLTRKITA